MEQLEAELKKLKVSDVLVQTVFTLSSLGFRKLGEDDRDLEQAKLAIEALRVLVPVLEGAVPAEVVRDFNQMVANIQLAYAKAAAEAKPEATVREGRPEKESAGEPEGSPGAGGDAGG
jgi:hypothetical protein